VHRSDARRAPAPTPGWRGSARPRTPATGGLSNTSVSARWRCFCPRSRSTSHCASSTSTPHGLTSAAAKSVAVSGDRLRNGLDVLLRGRPHREPTAESRSRRPIRGVDGQPSARRLVVSDTAGPRRREWLAAPTEEGMRPTAWESGRCCGRRRFNRIELRVAATITPHLLRYTSEHVCIQRITR
jgi:hypothetical protein